MLIRDTVGLTSAQGLRSDDDRSADLTLAGLKFGETQDTADFQWFAYPSANVGLMVRFYRLRGRL